METYQSIMALLAALGIPSLSVLAPYVLVAVVVYPMLRAKFPKLPDIAGLIGRIPGGLLGLLALVKKPQPQPANPLVPSDPSQPANPLVPVNPLVPAPTNQFPLLSAALEIWLKLRGIPNASTLAAIPAQAFKEIGDEWDAAVKAKAEFHEAQNQLLATASGSSGVTLADAVKAKGFDQLPFVPHG